MNSRRWIIGAILAGISQKLFLFPHNIPSGGAAGISVLLHHFLQLPNGTALFLVNVALLGMALRLYGTPFVMRTLATVGIMSLTVDFLPIPTPVLSTWMSEAIGAILFGISMSLIVNSGATTGGMDILAKWIEQRWHTPFGTNLLIINSSILLIAGIMLGWYVTVLGIATQFISNTIINRLRIVQKSPAIPARTVM